MSEGVDAGVSKKNVEEKNANASGSVGGSGSGSGSGLEEWEEQRNHHKALGDTAFRTSNFPTAIQEYTNAITFDPEFHILYSNRSAAHLANGEKSKSLVDARKCVELKPDFVKGHTRLATSLGSLGRWNEARAVYKHILSELDADNVIAKKGIEECRECEIKAKELKMEMMRKAEEAKIAKEKEEKDAEEKKQESNVEDTDAKKEDDGDDDDDLLNDFFDEVEETVTKKTAPPPTEPEKDETENKIQIQLNDLVDTKTQVERIMRPNHEWYNLNPFKVLDISHLASTELIGRRYRAISLLLHPDKVRNTSANDETLVERAEEAFEYVRRAMNSLKDETKAKHFVDLVEEGMKQGKRDYNTSSNANKGESLEQCQDKATMKIFAEIERKRRDVERRKRKQEQRERSQEDEELDKVKKERDFEKNWKEGTRVEKRIGNWRDFQKDKRQRH